MRVSAKDIARSVIADIAPDESEIFEQIWSEYSENPLLLATGPSSSDHHLGSGALADTSLLTLIIIPIVVGVAKDVAGRGMSGIIDYVKSKLGHTAASSPSVKLSAEEIDRIAEAVAARFVSKQ